MHRDSDVYENENGDPGSLNEILNGDVSERRENSKGTYEGTLVVDFS